MLFSGISHDRLVPDALYLEALAGIALSLAILMALISMAQQRTGNSGWVDSIWTFSVGSTGAARALWRLPGPDKKGVAT
jgi:steroid 5-alpha reductase family enzyme